MKIWSTKYEDYPCTSYLLLWSLVACSGSYHTSYESNMIYESVTSLSPAKKVWVSYVVSYVLLQNYIRYYYYTRYFQTERTHYPSYHIVKCTTPVFSNVQPSWPKSWLTYKSLTHHQPIISLITNPSSHSLPTHHLTHHQPIMSLITNPSSHSLPTYHPTHYQPITHQKPIIALITNTSSHSSPTHHLTHQKPIISLITNTSSHSSPTHHLTHHQPIISLITNLSSHSLPTHHLTHQKPIIQLTTNPSPTQTSRECIC